MTTKKTPRKKKGITRPRPDGGVINTDKIGITRPRPDGGVKINSLMFEPEENSRS